MQWKRRTEAPPENGKVLAVHRYQGILAVTAREIRENELFTHWGTPPVDGWIRREGRLPKAEDADFYNCVLAWSAAEGVCVTGWHRVVGSSWFDEWRQMPDPPIECD